MRGNHINTSGRRLDSWLGTRPLFETLLGENDLRAADRCDVVAHTIGAVVRYRAMQVHFSAAEIVDHAVFRILGRGRVPPVGMTRFIALGDRAWYQVTDWDVAQRVRRAFGRVPRRSDCTALYCGWRHHATRGGALPVFVLLDATWRVLEVAYADGDNDGVAGLWPGIGPDLRLSPGHVVPALQALAARLGIVHFSDQLHLFTSPQKHAKADLSKQM